MGIARDDALEHALRFVEMLRALERRSYLEGHGRIARQLRGGAIENAQCLRNPSGFHVQLPQCKVGGRLPIVLAEQVLEQTDAAIELPALTERLRLEPYQAQIPRCGCARALQLVDGLVVLLETEVGGAELFVQARGVQPLSLVRASIPSGNERLERVDDLSIVLLVGGDLSECILAPHTSRVALHHLHRDGFSVRGVGHLALSLHQQVQRAHVCWVFRRDVFQQGPRAPDRIGGAFAEQRRCPSHLQIEIARAPS